MERKYNVGDFIKKANEIHKGKYDYSKVVYINNKTNVCIICPEHGIKIRYFSHCKYAKFLGECVIKNIENIIN
jgi:hypothetical protein